MVKNKGKNIVILEIILFILGVLYLYCIGKLHWVTDNLTPIVLVCTVLWSFHSWKKQVIYNRKYKSLESIFSLLSELEMAFMLIRPLQIPPFFIPSDSQLESVGLDKHTYDRHTEEAQRGMREGIFLFSLIKRYNFDEIFTKAMGVVNVVDRELLGKDYDNFIRLLKNIKTLHSYYDLVLQAHIRSHDKDKQSPLYNLISNDKEELEVKVVDPATEEEFSDLEDKEISALHSKSKYGFDYKYDEKAVTELPFFDKNLKETFIEITDILRKKLNNFEV